MPSDTDFLKANPPQKPADAAAAEIPDGAFKLTNVNKPAGDSSGRRKKDKSKSKRETLIPGFQPKEKTSSGNTLSIFRVVENIECKNRYGRY